MSRHPVAVIDIGSNSIKLLVAARDAHGTLQAVATRTLDARISAGISHAQPRLGEEGMAVGHAAIRDLLAFAAQHQPAHLQLVATSAVRDAANGREFAQRVLTDTGHPIRILNGHEEASLIGRGLLQDPALVGLHDFHVFDLGGGSLECLSFTQRHIRHAASLQLGCVRLTEKFIPDPTAPIPPEILQTIAAHTHGQLRLLPFSQELDAPEVVFTGGSMTTARLIRGAEVGLSLEETSAVITVDELRSLLALIAPLPLEKRLLIPGLPARRADVYPAALATLIATAEHTGTTRFLHSLHNLRWGLADELAPQL